MDEIRHKDGAGQSWLLLSHAFNMDGRAASLTVTDKIPWLQARGITPIVISAQTGVRDALIEHHQVPAIAPSGLKFDMRHVLKKHFRDPGLYKAVKAAVSLALLPFYLLERAFIHLESQWSWFVMAYVTGAGIIKARRPRLIYSSGGANSAHLAGYLLARRFGLPWFAEVHDPMIHDQWRKSRMSYRWAAGLERRICRHAAAAWWFTEGALAKAQERNPELGERGHMIIPGVAAPDFRGVVYRSSDKFHIGHFGSLADSRSLSVVIQALHGVLERRPDYRGRVQIDLFGSNLDGASRKILGQFPLPGVIVEHGRLEADPTSGKSGRQQVLEAMRRSDLLLLLHGSNPSCEQYIPSKLFEYLWTRRPILGLVWKNPQMDRLLVERGHQAVNALDVEGVAAALLDLLQRWEQGALLDLEDARALTVEDAVNRIVSLAEALGERGAGVNE